MLETFTVDKSHVGGKVNIYCCMLEGHGMFTVGVYIFVTHITRRKISTPKVDESQQTL